MALARALEAPVLVEELQLLYETSRRISTAMSIDEVVTAYLEQVAAGGRYACSIALYEHDADGRRTAVAVQGRWSPEEGIARADERHPYTPDGLDAPLDAGQTVTIADAATDPRVPPALRAIQLQARRPALALVPLMVGSRRIGLVVLSFSHAHRWQPSELHPYQVTAAQLATAIHTRRQHQILQEHSRHVAILEERQRLARDLHDSATQLLFSLSLIAESVGPAWERDPEEGRRRVARVLELSQAARREMRHLLAELSPFADPSDCPVSTEPRALERVLSDGLPRALRQHMAEVSTRATRFSLRSRGYRPQPPQREEALFRVGQEAINNAVKHSSAATVTLTLGIRDDSATLSVRDDGCGFHLASAREKLREGRFGLAIMKQRIEALGGTLLIETTPGRGTCISARLPLDR